VPLLTVTPRNDRWIIHTVGYGQSLWAVAIAYGVKMDQIRDWNSMESDSTNVYAGQKLYIIAPAQIWPTLTASPEGGLNLAENSQTGTPGWSMADDPQAEKEKSIYQTSVAQAQITQQDNTGSQAIAAAMSTSTASPSPKGGVTPSPITKQVYKDPLGPPEGAAQGDNLPLLAGIFILFGGSLLVIITFSMMRKR
jgi:LysM repeat protein